MLLSTWLTVVTICLLGAMFPGPSLALVLRNTLNGGRHAGMVTGIFHGLAVGIYAFLSVLGLAAVITTLPWLFSAIQWAGAAYLLWLGIQGLRPKNTLIVSTQTPSGEVKHAARDGFLMACLNPKAAIFFLALFSQVVGPSTPLLAKLGYALTTMVIDMSWYVVVAWLFSRPNWLTALQHHSGKLEKVFGVILILLAAKIMFSA